MKRILVIFSLLLCVTSIVFAKEQKVNIYDTVLTFDIPDSYDIIDRNHPDPAVLKKLGATADEVMQEMKEDRNFLDCIDFDAGNEIVFLAISTEGTKRYKDLKNHKAAINSPNFKEMLIKTLSTPEIEVTNAYAQELPNATYAVFQGNSRELNEYDKYTYSKIFLTIKNGTMFVVKGMSWTGEHSKVDSALDTVINNMHFTTPGRDADSRAAERVATETLIVVFIVVAFIIVYWIYRKIKGKNNTDNDVLENHVATDNISLDNKQHADIQGLAQNPNGAAENETITTNIKMTNNSNSQTYLTIENIRELKQLLDDGIITQEEFDAAKKKILGL